MALSFHYISNGKLWHYNDGKTTELRSHILDSYIEKVKESAQRSEWKHSGEGAMFRDAYIPGADAESRVSAVNSRIFCADMYDGSHIYSLAIDRNTGIYRRTDGEKTDGIVISSGDNSYCDFDIMNDRMVLTSAFAGESHIGVLKMGSTDCRMYTEGSTWDSQPVWSMTEDDIVYFCSSGLPENNTSERPERPMDMQQMAVRMFTSAPQPKKRGPTAICRLDIAHGELTEFIEDEKYDHIRPQSLPNGSLCYIRRPYETESAPQTLGCLGDLFMLPVRLLSALFGFLNVFSAKYSGKTLSKTYGAKNPDEQKLFIDGNLINAEAELRANRTSGDKNPGIIPRSWELRCRLPNGDDRLIKKGVAAYHIDTTTGDIIISNGSAIIKIARDGSEEKLLSAEQVTFIR